jgi:hypothetical protein
MKKQTSSAAGKILALGASVAALGAATYYFFGAEGKKHQKNFKGWMIKMKADIIEKIEDAEEVTETLYHKIIDEVAVAYEKTGKVSKEEATLYADILKKQWKNIVASTKKPVKRIAKVVKVVKVAKTPIKRTVAKVVKKSGKEKITNLTHPIVFHKKFPVFFAGNFLCSEIFLKESLLAR